MEVSQRGFRESIRKPKVHKEAWLERKKERKDEAFLSKSGKWAECVVDGMW